MKMSNNNNIAAIETIGYFRNFYEILKSKLRGLMETVLSKSNKERREYW
jgi:hypothetical protein